MPRDLEKMNAIEMDPDYLEHLRHEKEAEQLELPWDYRESHTQADLI